MKIKTTQLPIGFYLFPRFTEHLEIKDRYPTSEKAWEAFNKEPNHHKHCFIVCHANKKGWLYPITEHGVIKKGQKPVFAPKIHFGIQDSGDWYWRQWVYPYGNTDVFRRGGGDVSHPFHN